MGILEPFLTLVLLVLWGSTTMYCYEFYKSGLYNRYKFRYWFSIGMLNIFHLFMLIVYKHTGVTEFLEGRWIAFLIIELLYLEIFIVPVRKRYVELFIRTGYYFLLVMTYSLDNDLIFLGNIAILFWLANKSEYNILRTHFRVSFLLYVLVITVPILFGYSTAASLIAGLIFSSHIIVGIRKLYYLEHGDEMMKQVLQVNNEVKEE